MSRTNPDSAQVAFSLVLLMAALLFVRSFRNILTLNAGFQQDHILVADFEFSPLKLSPASNRTDDGSRHLAGHRPGDPVTVTGGAGSDQSSGGPARQGQGNRTGITGYGTVRIGQGNGTRIFGSGTRIQNDEGRNFGYSEAAQEE
jgi:hypothetical protein